MRREIKKEIQVVNGRGVKKKKNWNNIVVKRTEAIFLVRQTLITSVYSFRFSSHLNSDDYTQKFNAKNYYYSSRWKEKWKRKEEREREKKKLPLIQRSVSQKNVFEVLQSEYKYGYNWSLYILSHFGAAAWGFRRNFRQRLFEQTASENCLRLTRSYQFYWSRFEGIRKWKSFTHHAYRVTAHFHFREYSDIIRRSNFSSESTIHQRISKERIRKHENNRVGENWTHPKFAGLKAERMRICVAKNILNRALVVWGRDTLSGHTRLKDCELLLLGRQSVWW